MDHSDLYEMAEEEADERELVGDKRTSFIDEFVRDYWPNVADGIRMARKYGEFDGL